MATTKHTTRRRRNETNATVSDNTEGTSTKISSTVAADIEAENQIIQQALRILTSRAGVPGAVIENMHIAADWFRLFLGEAPNEIFAVAWLDRDQRVIGFQELFHGTLDSHSVHPREVVRFAIQCNAAAAIFAHNLPSGTFKYYDFDEGGSLQLSRALACIGVRVIDHLVVSAGAPTVSISDQGMLAGCRIPTNHLGGSADPSSEE